MRTLKYHYGGQLGLAAGRGSEDRLLDDGCPVGEAVIELANHLGGEFRRLVLDGDDQLRSTLLVALDGEQVEDFSRPIGADAMEITLLTPIAGG